MRNALESNTWFCHAFCKIPKVKLVHTYREDEADGELERDMIQLAENAIQRKTHRQQLMDKSKHNGKASAKFDNEQKRSTRKGNQSGMQMGRDASQDDEVDVAMSEYQ